MKTLLKGKNKFQGYQSGFLHYRKNFNFAKFDCKIFLKNSDHGNFICSLSNGHDALLKKEKKIINKIINFTMN